MNKLLRFAFLFIGMTLIAQNQIPGQLDPTFLTGTGFEDNMDAVAVQPDGKIIVAGQGDTYQGVPFKRIIRLNEDGSPDPTFNGPDLLIYENYNVLELQPDGKILSLSHYAADVNSVVPLYHFKRMNTDGSLDTTFNAGGTGVVETPYSRIENMAVQPDGKIIIGGQFAEYNGIASKNIARLNADGTLDTSFVVGTGFNSSVYAICVQPDGKVIVSGDFTSYNGTSAYKFIRLNSDGSKDTTFTPNSVSGVGIIGLQSNGNIVIAGGFSTISGIARDQIAILNPNGTLNTANGTPPGPDGATNERVLCFTIQPDDKIIVGGYFTKWGGVNKRHLIRLNANGFPDNTFGQNGSPNYMVWDIKPYFGNRYVLSGGFERYGSTTLNYIARINGLSSIEIPTGSTSQTICGSGTLASLSVTGYGIRWYDAATDGNLLAATTPLLSGTTYYASQTISGNESANRLAVTVTLETQTTPTFTQVDPMCAGTSGFALPTTSTNGVTGTWSPNFNDAATRLYTFTPSAGECASTATMTVTITPNIASTFTQIAPICSGAELILPTTSNTGITGTWSPEPNNTTTTTYTFTPNSGQCGRLGFMTVTVNASTLPTFTQVAEICSGATLSALPVDSNNGINGSWSPALNNQQTTTYTFTPSAGQCASTATMTITVNPNVTPSFTQVSAICYGTTLSALPVDSNNGINGSWSPALNNLQTTTYTFTPSAGQCATTTMMTIAVNPNVTPTFTQVAEICSGATLSALPVDSNNGINGSWSPALNNLQTTTYTFTPASGQCATTTTMTIAVNNDVTPTFTQVAEICSGTTLSALPVDSNNGINGSWSPALNNLQTTTYTFTPSAGQCATTTTMMITVNPNVTPTFTQVAEICSGTILSALPVDSNNGINGNWSPDLNNQQTTTYTFTPSVGQCATTTTMMITVNPNVTPTFTQVAEICSGTTLSTLPVDSNNGINGSWSPALNNQQTTTYSFTPSAGQCATTTMMTITVNPNVTPSFTQVSAICYGTTLSALPVDSNNGINGSWSPALNNLETTTYTFTPSAGQCATTTIMTIAVNPNVTPTFTQVAEICSGTTLSALPVDSNNGINGSWSPALNNQQTTTYTFTPSAGQCATTTTMTITVNPNVTPTFTQVAEICSGATLSALPVDSNNGINGNWSPALNNQQTTTYTFTPSTGQCATTTTMTITVNPNVTPVFTQVAEICSGMILSALPVDSNNGINGNWSPALNNQQTTTYTFTPASGQCATTTMMTITVNPNVAPSFTQVSAICYGATLSALPVDSNNGINGSWSPALNNQQTTIYSFTPSVGQCAAIATMTIVVNTTPAPTGSNIQTITVDEAAEATVADLQAVGENVQWFASQENALTGQFPLDPTTVLETGNTYYAMQIVDDCPSVTPLAVTVSVTLGLDEITKPEWKVYPNPTAHFVTVSGNQTVESVKVFSMLGQVISDTKYNNSEVQLDLSGLPAAVYFVEVQSDNKSAVYRIVKN